LGSWLILVFWGRFGIPSPEAGCFVELGMNRLEMNAGLLPSTVVRTVVWLGGLAILLGCQNGPLMGRMKQSQLENERLLSEFRSQKREVEQLRADRDRLLQQQAETEKLAAKLQSQLNRRGGDPSESSLVASRPNSFQAPTRIAQDPRSPAAEYPRDFSSSGSNNSNRSTSRPSDSLQWRPIRKSGP
jgi:hypothetical protein